MIIRTLGDESSERERGRNCASQNCGAYKIGKEEREGKSMGKGGGILILGIQMERLAYLLCVCENERLVT